MRLVGRALPHKPGSKRGELVTSSCQDVREIDRHASGERRAEQFKWRGSGSAAAVDDHRSLGQVRGELEPAGPDEIDDGWRPGSHQPILQANGELRRGTEPGVTGLVNPAAPSSRPVR